MEDYKDSYDFRIFGEEYLKYKHFLFENNFIHLRILAFTSNKVSSELLK